MVAMFEVLAEPNRRRILEHLRDGQCTVNDMVARMKISQPTVIRHLKVLREAGLVSARVDAQRRVYRVRPEPLAEAENWIATFRSSEETRMNIEHAPVAKAEMLIRRPVAAVFEAFVDPPVTTRFWFTRSSGRLEAGKQVRWDWEMYDVSAQVSVKAIEANSRILIEWGAAGETPTTAEWVFTAMADDTTFVSITNSGFSGDGDEIVSQAIDAMGGFSLVIAGAKALLEHDIVLNLVADCFPGGDEDVRGCQGTIAGIMMRDPVEALLDEIDLRPDGRIRPAFTNSDSVVDSTIFGLDPPSVLEHRWISNGDDRGVARWELDDLGGRARLVLSHASAGTDRVAFMAGWKAHLQLVAALNGAPFPFPRTFRKARKAAFQEDDQEGERVDDGKDVKRSGDRFTSSRW